MRATDAGAGATLGTWLARLEVLHPSEIELGLERVASVWRRLGARRPGGRVITVAGTNGKGSTIATLDAVLRAHGLRTATTTSPHLVRFNERIVVDGEAATDAAIVAAFERIEAARGETSLTYFEFAILAALELMADAQPDVALLEVGLGGRLDAVNLIDADVAIITAVDLDHQAWLGDTREAIGAEKAGILRPGRPLVCGDRAPPASVLAAARALGAPAICLGSDFDLREDAEGWHFHGARAGAEAVDLRGLPTCALHADDVAAALQALLAAGFELDAAATGRALGNLSLAGRRQRGRIDGVEVLLDVAHNPHAARALATALPADGPLFAVFGTFADKDAAGMLAAFGDRFAGLWLVDTPGPRGRAASALAAALDGVTGATPVQVAGPALAGLDAALAAARAAGGRVLVLGSFTLVGAVLGAHRLAGTPVIEEAPEQ